VAKSRNKPNWLFRSLVGVSLAVHVVIFLHVSGLYDSKALTYIELTMQDISNPVGREIPRPRFRPKTPDVEEVKKLDVSPRRLPRMKPVKLDPPKKNLPDALVEGIGVPDVPETEGLDVASWSPGPVVDDAAGDCLTAQNYLEMVRLKIESHKKYPQQARLRNIEGRVTLRFVITTDGGVRDVEIVKNSRNRDLDAAAVAAVRASAPFSNPPQRFFNGDLPLELTIVFELT
jgi:protein TonB